MSYVISQVGVALKDALLMAWEVWWALVLGFAISAIVQAWVPRAAHRGGAGGRRARGRSLWATGLGAASSSCSYAAIAIAKSLFQKGASAVSALAFQFASTNLVWELGLVLWVLIGWQFTLAEYVGGHRDDRAHGAPPPAVRLAAARGDGPPPRAGGRHRPPAPRGRRAADAGASG